MRALLGFAAALALAICGFDARAQSGGGHDGHASAAPPLGALAGELTFRDVRGRPFSTASLRGGWTLVYFGYSRCRTACPVALPTLREAAVVLRGHGLDARAVFIDIEAQAQPLHVRTAASTEPEGHSHARRSEGAMTELARAFPSIAFLTGGRAEIRRAVEAFRVRAEHIPPRTQLGEQGHSINHTSLIYVLDPAGAIAGYVTHDVTPTALVALVEGRAR